LFQSRGILLRVDQDGGTLPSGSETGSLGNLAGAPILLGRIDATEYVTAEIEDEAPLGSEWLSVDLRSLYGRVPEIEWHIAGYASQVLHWRRTSVYCPLCGSTMGPMEPEWRRRCTRCDHERYPMVSPAVLALVHDGDRILLAHKPGWGSRRSILAGFALPEESLEECVHREVLEEAGVRVTDVVYFGSQPWPFPHQLMIGFSARYTAGEIVIDAEELAGAEWYDFRSMPPLPPPLSLSRQMIDSWVKSRADCSDL
jgi:NAD+ diphosphatase